MIWFYIVSLWSDSVTYPWQKYHRSNAVFFSLHPSEWWMIPFVYFDPLVKVVFVRLPHCKDIPLPFVVSILWQSNSILYKYAMVIKLLSYVSQYEFVFSFFCSVSYNLLLSLLIWLLMLSPIWPVGFHSSWVLWPFTMFLLFLSHKMFQSHLIFLLPPTLAIFQGVLSFRENGI